MTLNRLHRGKLGKKLVLFNAFVGRIKLTYEQYFLFAITYEKYFLHVLHMATFPYLFVQPKSALRITMINLFFVICLFLTHSRYWWTPLPPPTSIILSGFLSCRLSFFYLFGCILSLH